MFRKRLIKDKPRTYKFFETLGPNQAPLYLGIMTEMRGHDEDLWRWESAFGANCGEANANDSMHMIQKCARESEAVLIIKAIGMR